mgnify:CR=1 FL=1
MLPFHLPELRSRGSKPKSAWMRETFALLDLPVHGLELGLAFCDQSSTGHAGLKTAF